VNLRLNVTSRKLLQSWRGGTWIFWRTCRFEWTSTGSKYVFVISLSSFFSYHYFQKKRLTSLFETILQTCSVLISLFPWFY
jgi:hypothetical protein